MNIIRNNNLLEYQIPERQVAMKNEKSNIFINRVDEALTKYGMEPVENLMKHPKSKGKKKRIVRYHQNKHWHEICLEDQSNKKNIGINTGKPHHLCRTISGSACSVQETTL